MWAIGSVLEFHGSIIINAVLKWELNKLAFFFTIRNNFTICFKSLHSITVLLKFLIKLQNFFKFIEEDPPAK